MSAFASLLHSFALLLLYPDKNQCPQWHVWYGIDEISALPTMSFITIHKEVYTLFSIFDPSDYGNDGQLQSINHGPHFSRRLIDAVQSLKCNLQSLGSDLILRTGNPLHVIPPLVQQLGIDEVAWSEVMVITNLHNLTNQKRYCLMDRSDAVFSLHDH